MPGGTLDKAAQDAREQVLLKIRQSSDFPAMANTVSMVNGFNAAEDATVSELANIILKDYALTTKVLKVVNSVHYYQAGEVTTISRAIFLLGFEQVKTIALTLMLFDRLNRSGENSELLEVLVESFWGGIIAQKIVHDLNFVEEEEAFLCTLLHPLGKIMVAFAMPGKVAEVREAAQGRNLTEDAASRLVLGISYDEIGTTIGREWNFPQKIIDGMQHTSPSMLTSHPREAERLGSIATFSCEMASVLAAETERGEKDARLRSLASSYAPHFGGVSARMDALISSSFQELADFSCMMNVDMKATRLSRQLSAWDDAVASKTGCPPSAACRTDAIPTIDTILGAEESAETIFSRGIQDINSAMLGSYSLNDIILIALETMYRSMKAAQLTRSLFFVRNTREPVMDIRLGFGADVEASRKWFVVRVGSEGDLFNIALSRDSDLIIRDIDAAEIARFVPAWYRAKVVLPSYMLLLPLTIQKRNIGLYYLEGRREGFDQISKGQFNYLRILRDQTAVSIKQMRS